MNDIITSRTNPVIVETAKLSDKKYRDSSGLFIFEGYKLFFEALDADISIKRIFMTEEAYTKYLPEIKNHLSAKKLSPVIVSESVYEKISGEKSPQGVLCVAEHLDNFHKRVTIYNIEDKNEFRKIFICASIRDPGNLGTMIRSAAAFGIDELILSGDCADIYNPKTIRAAMGALFRLRTTRTDSLAASICALRNHGYYVYAAALHTGAQDVRSISCSERTVFAVGNEGHGLDANIIGECSGCVIIPMSDGSESLNASAAASVLLWEMKRTDGYADFCKNI